MEKWANIAGYDGKYQISDRGEVRIVPKPRKDADADVKYKTMKLQENHNGYLRVTLYRDGKEKTHRVNRLVADAFIPNPQEKPQVNHKDGNKHNNSVDNLEWATPAENIRHAMETGLMPDMSAYDCGSPKVPVAKCDLATGSVIETYKSIAIAAYENGLRRGNISGVIHGRRRSCGGYYWRVYRAN